MDITDLRTNMLVADGRTLLKVSTVHSPTGQSDGYVTAQVLLPKPDRTTVREYGAIHIYERWKTPSDAMVRRYEEAWGLPAGGTP
jgi:hypothetical protein